MTETRTVPTDMEIPSDRDRALGRDADRPGRIPPKGWWIILKRTWAESSRDNVGIVAAGVAFLCLLAIFPAMSAAMAIYGLVADPDAVERQLEGVTQLLPAQARDPLLAQVRSLAEQAGGTLGIGLAVSILVALWSASGGVKALMTALNIAYDEEERRGFLAFTVTALVLTLGFLLLLFGMVALVVVVPAILGLLGLGGVAEGLIRWLRWPVVALVVAFALAVLYRYAPCRARPRWRWVSWGAAAATLLWLVGSIGFSIYIANFADYNATYGALGGAIILLLWLYLGAYAILLGAELDAEMEHQTARDTTTGPERPMGRRGAYVADHMAQ